MPAISPFTHVNFLRQRAEGAKRVRTSHLRQAIKAIRPYRGQGMGPVQVYKTRKALMQLRTILDGQNSAVYARKIRMLDSLRERLQWNVQLAELRHKQDMQLRVRCPIDSVAAEAPASAASKPNMLDE